MDKYYPEISFPLEHTRGIDSEPIPFRISFNSHNRDGAAPPKGSRREDVDWDCTAVGFLTATSPGRALLTGPQCGAVNFPHRAVCYKCRAERPGLLTKQPCVGGKLTGYRRWRLWSGLRPLFRSGINRRDR